MLLDCPECGHRVSDRAAACPQCGFPVAAEVAAQKERDEIEADKQARSRIGDVDCAQCDARGFTTEGPKDRPTAFSWCVICEHSGRVPLVQSPRGYWAVGFDALDRFLEGATLDPPNVVYLGEHAPEGHRYENAGPRRREDAKD